MPDYSRTRLTLDDLMDYLKGRLASSQPSWSIGQLFSEQDMDKAFRILDVIQPPGIIVLAEESRPRDAVEYLRHPIVMVPFTRKLTIPSQNVAALQVMADAIFDIFDYQILSTTLFRFDSEKAFSLDRWSGIVATKVTYVGDDRYY